MAGRAAAVGWWALAIAAAFGLAGCSEQRPPAPPRVQAVGPPAYGEPKGVPAAFVSRARPMATNDAWRSAPFYCLQTELSPATLFHSAAKSLSVFTGLEQVGLGAPSHVAFVTLSGPRSFTNGAPLDVSHLGECWVLAWFAGAKGWTNWDSPWAVYLQHKPTAMKLDAQGLHFEFAEAAGDVVLLPLYGYYKPPLEGRDFAAAHGLPARKEKVQTWKWPEFLPREVLMRVRYWASTLREFPVYCEDSFSVDRAADSVTIRQRIRWHTIRDDWNTVRQKVAPISPPLAQAWQDQGFPIRFSRRVADLDLFTPYGPYVGIEGVDEYDATLAVLQYVNETEISDPLPTNAPPAARAALERLRATVKARLRGEAAGEGGGPREFWDGVLGERWFAKALPYCDDATRAELSGVLRQRFREEVLVTNRFIARELPSGSARVYLLPAGVEAGMEGGWAAAAQVGANLLETLWAYAHFSGDWALIRERWDLIRKLFTPPAQTRWVGFGRDGVAALGDQAAPCLAMARLAYQAGDLDEYGYAGSLFARELVHHYLKQRGAPYFRKHQPWHSMEPMDEEVYLTHLEGGLAGWHIDGPNYPAGAAERWFERRWARFGNEDVARFYREFLPADVAAELGRLQRRWDGERRFTHEPGGLPSLVQLRSLLLNETPAALAALAGPERFSGPPAGVIASCLAVIRTSHPTRYQRLIPMGGATPFVAGLERDVPGPNVFLAQALEFTRETQAHTAPPPDWPEIRWPPSWRTPGGEPWTFGRVTPGNDLRPAAVKIVPLNWNTLVAVYSPP